MNSFEKLFDIVVHLRGENGCPWDKKQTLKSLTNSLIEEAYETVEGMESGNAEDLKEELGDLIFLSMMIGYIAQQDGLFRLEEAVDGASEKLIRRHPHVFGENKTDNPDEALQNWEKMKMGEKKNQNRKTLMDGIPAALPEIQLLTKVLSKVKRIHGSTDDLVGEDLSALFSNVMSDFSSESLKPFLLKLFIESQAKEIDFGRILRESAKEISDKYS